MMVLEAKEFAAAQAEQKKNMQTAINGSAFGTHLAKLKKRFAENRRGDTFEKIEKRLENLFQDLLVDKKELSLDDFEVNKNFVARFQCPLFFWMMSITKDGKISLRVSKKIAQEDVVPFEIEDE